MGNPIKQLNLFKMFVKSIKAIDLTAQIIPFQSVIKINVLSTTAQINNF